MRLLLDMNVSPRLATDLRALGHDVVHLLDEALERLDDGAVLTKARTEGRVLVTSDLDFGEIIARSRHADPSVVVCRLRDDRPVRMFARLLDVLADPDCQLALGSGAIVLVEDDRHRLRRLPIGR